MKKSRTVTQATRASIVANASVMILKMAASHLTQGGFYSHFASKEIVVECETSSCVSAEEHAELSRETALASASLQMKNELTSVAQYAVGQGSIMR